MDDRIKRRNARFRINRAFSVNDRALLSTTHIAASFRSARCVQTTEAVLEDGQAQLLARAGREEEAPMTMGPHWWGLGDSSARTGQPSVTSSPITLSIQPPLDLIVGQWRSLSTHNAISGSGPRQAQA
jgi:hypothetical protein